MSSPITPPRDRSLADAAAWLIRLQSDRRSAADVEAFQAWAAADASHAVAFEAISGTWDVTGGLSRDMRGQDRARSVSRRHALVAAGGAAIAIGSGVTYFLETGAWSYRTEIGEQKRVVLADGSRMFLDTNTRVDVNFGKSLRSAELQYGRINLQVVAEPWRPFVVDALADKIVVGVSALDVRRDDDQISVLVIQGSAEVRRPNFPVAKLDSGERFMVVANNNGQRDRPSLVPLLAWQTGQAIFENGKLSDAVAEMNRYSTTRLVIVDSDVGEIRMSGVYLVGDNMSFANSISRLLPVKIVREDNRINILPDRTRRLRG